MKKVLAWIMIGLFIAITATDLILTYINTPDLAREANVLVSHFGFGWPMLITVNIIIVMIYAVLVYYSFVTYPHKKERARQGKGKPGSYLLAVVGCTLGVSLLLSRLIPVLQWVAITQEKSYHPFLQWLERLCGGRSDLVVSGIIGGVVAVLWTIFDLLDDRKHPPEQQEQP